MAVPPMLEHWRTTFETWIDTGEFPAAAVAAHLAGEEAYDNMRNVLRCALGIEDDWNAEAPPLGFCRLVGGRGAPGVAPRESWVSCSFRSFRAAFALRTPAQRRRLAT